MPSPHTPPPVRLRLAARAESAVRSGHPWVFADSVRSASREGAVGDIAVIYDRRDKFLAAGLYDPGSPLRVRLVQWRSPAKIDGAFWRQRASECSGRRGAPGALPPETDGYRCINGESERFPGLVADRYGPVLVVKIYTLAWLPRWDEVEAALRETFAPQHLVLRFSRNIAPAARRDFGLAEGFAGPPGPPVVVFREAGLRFEAEVLHGQKTGFFLDQRENRLRAAGLAGGGEVLNAFSFSGGFSLHAAAAGARAVTDLDISRHALAAAERNFDLNRGLPDVAAARHETVQADAFAWLEEGGAGRRFDLVIVDPPSLARRARDRDAALAGYRRLARAAVRRVRPGGHLLLASCSAHVDRDAFFSLARAEVRGAECWTAGHAADHPAAFREADYLKAICFKVARAGA